MMSYVFGSLIAVGVVLASVSHLYVTARGPYPGWGYVYFAHELIGGLSVLFAAIVPSDRDVFALALAASIVFPVGVMSVIAARVYAGALTRTLVDVGVGRQVSSRQPIDVDDNHEWSVDLDGPISRLQRANRKQRSANPQAK